MEILQTKVMRGPNYWSADQHKLIVLKVSQRASAALKKDRIEELGKKLELLHPSFKNLANSDTLYRLTGSVALTLQSLAGMNNEYLHIATAGHPGACIVFSYTIEDAGIYAAQAAVRLINALIGEVGYDILPDINELNKIKRRQSLGPSTKAITDAGLQRGIPFTRLDNDSLIMLGWGRNQRLIRAAVASSTSAIAVELAQDKETTKKILKNGRVPVPAGTVAWDMEVLHDAIDELGFPLVIKPLDGNHGRGITSMIRSVEEAITAFQLAQQISEEVVIERHIHGNDYRFLVINYKLEAVAKRTPAQVTGDGFSTIKQLVDKTNEDPRRGNGHENVLTAITIDEATLAILTANGLTTNSVLPRGKSLYLKATANISTGGTADDVTDIVHPQNRFLAERIARLMGLDICGIDVIAADVAKPITADNGAVLEVNAGPGLRMHLAPSSGTPRNVALPVIDMLFPQDTPARIPLVAVTGTNGKTTTTRLIAHLARQAGYTAGFTTTDGIYIDNQLIEEGDCSGPQSAAIVLRDPGVDFAVLECARGGILRAGLGFDKCDVSIVTNITADHLGLDGMETVEDLAKVKSVVPKSTSADGYAILNADDDLVYGMKEGLACKIALFSLNASGSRIQQHLNEGKLAAFIENDYFTIANGAKKERIAKVKDVPLTMGGQSECMIKNILPAILAAFVNRFSVAAIREGLNSFIPSPENTPGRMNVFEFPNFRLMVDYAHNEDGYQELKKYAEKITASTKTGIIAAAGDRRDQDIRKVGRLSAQIFDEIIIRHDKDGRGRTNEEITELLMDGIKQIKPHMMVQVVSDEIESIKYAMDKAERDEWIFVNTDNVHGTLAFLKDAHAKRMLNNQLIPVLV